MPWARAAASQAGKSATSRSYSSASGTRFGSWPAWKKPALSIGRFSRHVQLVELAQELELPAAGVAEADELPEERQPGRLAHVPLGHAAC